VKSEEVYFSPSRLHVVADYEGRSANSQVLILIRKCVEQYEKENGKIKDK